MITSLLKMNNQRRALCKSRAYSIVMHFNAKDLTGNVYGKLTVIKHIGCVKYGGRMQSNWHCECECGNTIDLPLDKLPVSGSTIKSGRRLYDCCEECRFKTCPICGDKFSYSHPSHICPSQACQEELMKQRDAYWHAVAGERYKNDPEYRKHVRKQLNDWYAKNAEAVQMRRKERLDNMSPDEYAEWIEVERLRRREYLQKKELANMLADMQSITGKKDSE